MMSKGMTKAKIVAASILGCMITLQFGAFSVTLETMLSGITELPFGTFVATMQPIHLAIGFVEGLITAAVLVFVHEARPELLYCSTEAEKREGRFTFKNTLVVLAVVTVLIGGGLSLVASSNPDGLEWSIEKITGFTEVESDGGIYETVGSVQETTALLPDYTFKNSESSVGTTFSGIVGSVIVVGVCVGACYAFKFFRKKKA